jgi:hypothetical protein
MAMPAVTMPAPMATVPAMPAAMPVMTPAHLFGLETVHFVFGGDSRTDIRGRQPAAFFQRMRCEWCCMRARGQRGGAGGKSNSEFQKVAAFHVISSWCMASDAGEILIAWR